MTTSLKPLPEDLPEGMRNLANAIRVELVGSRKSMRQVALEAHVSASHVSQLASGRRKPTETTLGSILRATDSDKTRPRFVEAHSYVTRRWRDLLLAASLVFAGLASGLALYLVSDHAQGGCPAVCGKTGYDGDPSVVGQTSPTPVSPLTPAPSPGPVPVRVDLSRLFSGLDGKLASAPSPTELSEAECWSETMNGTRRYRLKVPVADGLKEFWADPSDIHQLFPRQPLTLVPRCK